MVGKLTKCQCKYYDNKKTNDKIQTRELTEFIRRKLPKIKYSKTQANKLISNSKEKIYIYI